MATANQPTKIGKYEILSTLGRGGMGVVYKARDPMIDRIVAVKTILVGEEAAGDESLLDRLHMEARSAGRLQHPNIVTVFDFGEQDDLSYIVMEYVEGINLARLIDERKPLGLDSKISILIQIAEGLAYAHEHGVVHRDMKPSNVCVTARGTAKILDFGLARFDSTRLTKTGYMAGTIAYMSPERLSGETGAQDDIFALGAIAYELLTYKRAFPGSMAPEVISRIITPTPPAAPSEVASVPKELDVIVLKALAKEKDARYETASDFSNDLRHFLQSDSLAAYLSDERRLTLEQQNEFVDSRASAHAYSGPSSRSRAIPPATMRIDVGAEPTRIEAPPTAIVADVTTAGMHTESEVDLTTSAAPTQVVPAQSKRRPWAAVAAAAGIIAGIGITIALLRPTAGTQNGTAPPKSAPPLVVPVTPQKPPGSQVTVVNPLQDTSAVQLATAKNLSAAVERRKLNTDELTQLSHAKAQIAVAEQKLKEKDYENGTRLIADSIAGLQKIMSANDKRVLRTPAVTPAVSKTSKVKPPSVGAIVEPPPQPQQTATTEVTGTAATSMAGKQTAPIEKHEPPLPPAESQQKLIGAFMQELAAAYQSKDVDFFRQRQIGFNDELARAIRNSPSVRVELHVERIDLIDAQHAAVVVRRTDWFPGASTPPATQSLVYHLQREGERWKIASISRA